MGGAIDAGVPWSAPSPPAVCPDFGRFGHETDRQTYQYNYGLTVWLVSFESVRGRRVVAADSVFHRRPNVDSR
ncbi:hypothetical protein SVXHx_3070 (plasmid) [Haloferax volcanii]|nr:hypothetical protein SVXHx_3070 [Haloferax lucentense]